MHVLAHVHFLDIIPPYDLQYYTHKPDSVHAVCSCASVLLKSYIHASETLINLSGWMCGNPLVSLSHCAYLPGSDPAVCCDRGSSLARQQVESVRCRGLHLEGTLPAKEICQLHYLREFDVDNANFTGQVCHRRRHPTATSADLMLVAAEKSIQTAPAGISTSIVPAMSLLSLQYLINTINAQQSSCLSAYGQLRQVSIIFFVTKVCLAFFRDCDLGFTKEAFGSAQIPDLLCSPACFNNVQEFDFSYNKVHLPLHPRRLSFILAAAQHLLPVVLPHVPMRATDAACASG